jgi:hypothetical protein
MIFNKIYLLFSTNNQVPLWTNPSESVTKFVEQLQPIIAPTLKTPEDMIKYVIWSILTIHPHHPPSPLPLTIHSHHPLPLTIHSPLSIHSPLLFEKYSNFLSDCRVLKYTHPEKLKFAKFVTSKHEHDKCTTENLEVILAHWLQIKPKELQRHVRYAFPHSLLLSLRSRSLFRSHALSFALALSLSLSLSLSCSFFKF